MNVYFDNADWYNCQFLDKKKEKCARLFISPFYQLKNETISVKQTICANKRKYLYITHTYVDYIMLFNNKAYLGRLDNAI